MDPDFLFPTETPVIPGKRSDWLEPNDIESLTLRPARLDSESSLTWLQTCQTKTLDLCLKHLRSIETLLVAVFLIGYSVYLGFAFSRSKGGWELLIVLTVIGVTLGIYELFKYRVSRRIHCSQNNKCKEAFDRAWRWGRWLFYPVILIALVAYLSLVVVKTSSQVLAIFGYCLFTCLTLITSKYVTQIRWRPVVAGLVTHIVLAIIFLRFRTPYVIVHWLGGQVTELLRHSLRGGTTAFGNPTAFLHPLLMVVTPVIIYMSALSAFFTHIGLTIYLSKKISWTIRRTLATSYIESMSMADGLLTSMMDYSTDFKPYTPRLTPSELLTTVVSAHSNLSGFMYGLFTIFWVKPQDLFLSAMIAAPSGVALAKLNHPEVHETRYLSFRQTRYNRRGNRNIFESTALGAWHGGQVVVAIVLQLIAFVAMYELFDMTLIWLGKMVQAEINFRVLLSYLFCPLGYLVGLPSEEVRDGSYVMGLYMVQNEVIAYLELGSLRMANTLTRRTISITTTAISGFSSFSSMTLVMGAWHKGSPMAYRRAVSSLYRAYLVTKLASLMTACLVAIFYDERLISDFETDLDLSDSWLNVGRLLSLLPSYKQLLLWLGIII